MSLADYLAKNYLTADSLHGSDRPKKKRKRNKHAEETDGLIIADDDPPDLRSASTTQQKSRRGFGYDDDDDDMGLEATIAGSSKEFKKSKSKWKTVAGPTAPANAEQLAADAILASAAAERTARAEEEEDEKPLVVDNDDREDGVLRMESGARAGLQTAAQTAAMVAAQERKHAKDAASMRTRQAKGEEAETIYRDASGRIINVAMKRAEVRKAAEEAAAKEAAEKEALTGDVQRKQKEERRKLMEDAKYMPLARTAEDEELNAELKARERWNDPAAQFLTKPSATSAGAKKMYKGAAPPNRYRIRPGHRWDGVDRSNGFEKQWFDARNRRERNEGLAYAWQMDE
ncbi:pre-mRNA-splicing factor cwc26 [Coccidioides immitis H538.4]|uniref:Pre-mRNA-splicing factor cwc26 n=1 Tax=Coccidioides immitis H538.4 TaxID=396776 RepID=A0A0J8RQC8_COCIT|nr:pre-mRNA-splicing factor cwc26 [Coccidioides immitis H538.4]